MFDVAELLFLPLTNRFNTKNRTFAVRNESKNGKRKALYLL